MKNFTVVIKEVINDQPMKELETILMQTEGVERAVVDMDDGEVNIFYDENQVEDNVIKNRMKQHGFHLK